MILRSRCQGTAGNRWRIQLWISVGRFNKGILYKVWRGCREPMQIVQYPKANNKRIVLTTRPEGWGQAVTAIRRGELYGKGLQRNHFLWWSDLGLGGARAGKYISEFTFLPLIICWTFVYWPPQPEANGKETNFHISRKSCTQGSKQGKEGWQAFVEGWKGRN